jgi:hypothetical protein
MEGRYSTADVPLQRLLLDTRPGDHAHPANCLVVVA